MSAFHERILKLAPGRFERYHQLIAQGHVELMHGCGPQPNYLQLVAWGWMVQERPVHFLDAYEGHRPTTEGLHYLLYDERCHLIMIRADRYGEVMARISDANNVAAEAAMVNFGFQLELARSRGFHYAEGEAHPEGLEEAIARYERRGYWTLDRFMDRYKVERDELHVSGVLRYVEHRDPDAVANIAVGTKARHCLLCSTRWQTFFVRPGMAEELYRLTLVEVREV
jgi:hypothetical protein